VHPPQQRRPLELAEVAPDRLGRHRKAAAELVDVDAAVAAGDRQDLLRRSEANRLATGRTGRSPGAAATLGLI